MGQRVTDKEREELMEGKDRKMYRFMGLKVKALHLGSLMAQDRLKIAVNAASKLVTQLHNA